MHHLFNRVFFLFVIIGIITSSLSAQTKKDALDASKLGYEFEQQNKMSEALFEYNKAIALDPRYPYPLERIGGMYQKLRNYPRAIQMLSRALQLDSNFDDYIYYNLGISYKALHKFDTALIYYKIFLRRMKPLVAEDSSAVREARMLEIYTEKSIELQRQPKNTDEPVRLGGDINTKYDDFAPAITADGKLLFFSSRRASSNSVTFAETKDYGDDIFGSKRDGSGNWGPAVALPAPINSKDDEGAAGISPDGQSVYYSLCRRADGFGDCDIYQSILNGSDWSRPQNIGREFNSQAWDAQPSISPDGNAMYFSSRRAGSIDGSEDIWVSFRGTDNIWGHPVSLGEPINTPSSERSPFMSADGVTLYFSSNGHPGFGGHDLFMTRKQPDGTWSEPVNLGSPINSPEDDEFLSIPAQGKTVYYSSRRDAKNGLDIYEAILPSGLAPNPVTLVSGTVLDKLTHKPLSAKIELSDLAKDEPLGTFFSNSTTGKFYFSVAAGKNYGITATGYHYTFYSQHYNVPDTAKYRELNYQIELIPLEQDSTKPIVEHINDSIGIQLNNIFFDFNKSVLRSESIPELKQLIKFLVVNTKLKIEISGHTDSVGTLEYNRKLSQDRAEAVRLYLIEHNITANRVTARGYGATLPIAPNDSEENRQRNRRTEFKIISRK